VLGVAGSNPVAQTKFKQILISFFPAKPISESRQDLALQIAAIGKLNLFCL
jgi:hypothetical protein